MALLRIVDVVPYPGGRLNSDGPYSGQWFRENFLAPQLADAVRDGGKLEVILDGAPGYGVSFLEEAFGGLIRKSNFTAAQMSSLKIVAHEKLYEPFVKLIDKYIKNAIAAAT